MNGTRCDICNGTADKKVTREWLTYSVCKRCGHIENVRRSAALKLCTKHRTGDNYTMYYQGTDKIIMTLTKYVSLDAYRTNPLFYACKKGVHEPYIVESCLYNGLTDASSKDKPF